MEETKGVIYILTNPSFPEYVKIGYADDVKRRLKELNRSECTPFAFRLYAYYEVNHRLTDMKLHNIIDRLNPDLRSIDNVDGKKRIREFYAMSKEDAYALFEAIAEINGLSDNLHLVEPTKKDKKEESIAKEIINEDIGYNENYHLSRVPKDIVILYNSLKNATCNNFELTIDPHKMYIAFKHNGKNIFDVRLLKSKIWIWINMPKGSLNDPKEFTRDVSNIGHWGNGDYDLTISNEQEIDYVLSLIKQSYENKN